MRSRSTSLFLLTAIAAAAWASPSAAQSATDPGDDPTHSSELEFASTLEAFPGRSFAPVTLTQVRSSPDRAPRTPLAIAGSVCAGLGGATLMAAGITWLVAAGESMALDDECPNKICYTGTRGGDAYERARDAERGADILVGIGAPVMGAGIMMLLYAAALGRTTTPV